MCPGRAVADSLENPHEGILIGYRIAAVDRVAEPASPGGLDGTFPVEDPCITLPLR
jgi:hypothetical protein